MVENQTALWAKTEAVKPVDARLSSTNSATDVILFSLIVFLQVLDTSYKAEIHGGGRLMAVAVSHHHSEAPGTATSHLLHMIGWKFPSMMT